MINLVFVRIGDFITSNSSFPYGINPFVNPEQRFFLVGIINLIPAKWHSVLKTSADVLVFDSLPNTPTIKMENDNLVPSLDASS